MFPAAVRLAVIALPRLSPLMVSLAVAEEKLAVIGIGLALLLRIAGNSDMVTFSQNLPIIRPAGKGRELVKRPRRGAARVAPRPAGPSSTCVRARRE